MLLKCVVLLCFVVSCLGARNKGQACTYLHKNDTILGTCKLISDCPQEHNRVYRDEKKPNMCWWDGEKMIVCCSKKPLPYLTGRFGRLFISVDEGIKMSNSTICRYDGERLHCCPIVRHNPVAEDTNCPPLDKPAPPPTLSPVQRIAWNKCVENLRYVDLCIAKNGDRYRLIRQYECSMRDDPFRIAGGEDAKPKEFPHMVVLGLAEDHEGDSTFTGQWVGGGALVSDRFVLTAGHVLVDPAGRPLRYALMGSPNKKDILKGLLRIIVRKIPHPLYQLQEKLHDIALLELDRPVTLSSFVRPICLPVPGQDTDRKRELLVAGWGITFADSTETTDLLQTATVSLQNDYSECEKLSVRYNSSTMLCAKGKLNARSNLPMDTCQGDSGGPLMSVLSNVKCSYRAEGVVSFGPKCGGGSAAVYTRVEHYLDWIVRNVWKDEWERATGRGATD